MISAQGDEAVDAAGENAEVGDCPEEDEDGMVDEALAGLGVGQDGAQNRKEGSEKYILELYFCYHSNLFQAFQFSFMHCDVKI